MRGIGNPSKAKHIGKRIRDHKLGLVGLLESRVKCANIAKVTSGVHFFWNWVHNGHYHNHVRILLGWAPALSWLFKLIYNLLLFFWLTMVYGVNSLVGKKDFWKEIGAISRTMLDRWCNR